MNKTFLQLSPQITLNGMRTGNHSSEIHAAPDVCSKKKILIIILNTRVTNKIHNTEVTFF